MFPEPGKNDVLSCHALTPDFLVLGTDMGGVSYFFLEDWVTVQGRIVYKKRSSRKTDSQ